MLVFGSDIYNGDGMVCEGMWLLIGRMLFRVV